MDFTTISGLGEEAMAPLLKAITDELPEKRGAALLKAQQAVRVFVAAAERGETPATPVEPIARMVHEILAKAAAPKAAAAPKVEQGNAALAKSVDAELQDLVKSQTAKAKDRLEKGMLSGLAMRAGNAIGIGRKAGTRAMMAGARSARAGGIAERKAATGRATEYAYERATRGMPASAARHQRGVEAARAQRGFGERMELEHGATMRGRDARRGAENARSEFNWRRERAVRRATNTALVAASAGMTGAAGYGAYRNFELQSPVRRRKSED
jgi:hypothetical protein